MGGLADPDGIYLRCVRHHDDHTPLPFGNPGDYGDDPREILYAVSEPTTDEQREFIESRASVRVVNGWPGSGKTTSLWLAVEQRCQGPTLYLTWSDDLARAAQRRFDAFADGNADIFSTSFEALWATITQETPTRLSYQESLRRFRVAIEKLNREIAPWRNHSELLYGELRACYIGTYGTYDPDSESITVLNNADKDYLKKRGSEIGAAEAKAVSNLFRLLREGGQLYDIFPELWLALKCRHTIEEHGLPEKLGRFEHIVVDEVQDLTRVEILTLLFAARATAQKIGRWPEMLFAGDERQTVRPTHFRWADLTLPLGAAVTKPEQYDLQKVLRCPDNVSQVLESLCDLWRDLKKEARPGRAVGVETERHLQGVIMHARAKTWAEVEALAASLEDAVGTRFIATGAEDHAELSEDLAERVQLPAQVKGLDFQTVFVLNPGKALIQLVDDRTETSRVFELGSRRRIDSLCVAISRTSEALVLIDVDEGMDPDRAERAWQATRAFAPTAQPADVPDLVERFRDASRPPEELALLRCEEAHRVVFDNARRAWLCVTQAFRMLGDRDLPNSIADIETRQTVSKALVTVATQIVSGLLRG